MNNKNKNSNRRPALSRIFATLVATVLISNSVLAQDASIRPNFQDVDIRQIIEAVAQVTGKNFIIDPRVNQQSVTMISQTSMTPDAFYNAFLSLLQVYGFVAVPAGNVIKIVPDANARQMPGAASNASGPDEIVTRVIKVDNIVAAQLVPILRPMIPQYGHLVAYPASNMLIISDRASNVSRIVSIVRRIDQEGADEIDIIPLQHASAGEVVRVITSLTQGRADGSSPGSSLAADDRTNSVLIGGDANRRLKMKALIVSLDTPLEDGGNTRVRYLFYADAEDLATRLQEQINATQTNVAAGGAPGTGPNQAQVTVWADVMNNALVVTAPAKEMRNLMAIVDKLDVRRAQVLVEAIIVEVSANKVNDIGVSWVAFPNGGGGNLLAISEFRDPGFSIANQLTGNQVPEQTGLGSNIPEGLTAAVGRVRDGHTSWAAVISALAGDADTNILSTPTIVTMDNEEAEITVAQEVPFVTGQFTDTGGQGGGQVNPFQTIERETVGIILTITPQINEGNAVMLKVSQEQSSIAQGATNAVDLITNKRTITTNVIVEDGGIVVLGGLIEDQLVEFEQRVPVLGSIPLLGYLFRQRSTTLIRTNLMVFIKPTILREGTQANFASGQRYNFMRDLQLDGGVDPGQVQMMPDQLRPALPVLPPIPAPTTGVIDLRAPVDASATGDGATALGAADTTSSNGASDDGT